MIVSCVQTAVEIEMPCADVIVFPEYSELAELTTARSICPDSIIVGSIVEEDQSRVPRGRGILFHQGTNQIDYLKFGSDTSGETKGTDKRPERLPVYEFGNVCIGILICMDVTVELEAFRRAVFDEVRARQAAFKLLCIPAAMSKSVWSWSNPLQSNYRGVHIVLCNSHTKGFLPGCSSFIANPDGVWIAAESPTNWPISATLFPAG